METAFPRQVRDVFAEEMNRAGLRGKKSNDEFQQDAFAHSGRAEQNARFGGRDGKADVLKDWRSVEGYGNTAQIDHGTGVLVRSLARRCGSMAHVGKTERSTCVIRKSTAMISTDDVTTAEIVDRPTPSVPPVVLMP